MDETTTLALFDRFVNPIRDELRTVDAKMDRMLAIGERMAAQEQGHRALLDRVTKVETDSGAATVELATLKGRHQVLLWLVTGIGGPSLLILIGAGINALLHLPVGK